MDTLTQTDKGYVIKLINTQYLLCEDGFIELFDCKFEYCRIALTEKKRSDVGFYVKKMLEGSQYRFTLSEMEFLTSFLSKLNNKE